MFLMCRGNLRIMKTKILIIIVALLIVGTGVWFWMGQTRNREGMGGPSNSHLPGANPSGVSRTPAPTPDAASVPKPPSGEPAVYKGFWMPAMYLDDNQQDMSSVARLKDAGANIVLLGPNAKINSAGEVRFDVPEDYIETRLYQLSKRYYGADIRIGFVIETLYVKSFSDNSPAGGPGAFPSDKVSQPGFLDKYNQLVGRMAKLAQKYHVDIFSPMNEPDLKLGPAMASKWGQEILPLVKENYSGKALWKSAGGALDKYNTDFKGYDIIGFDPSPGGGPFEQSMATYRQALSNLLTIAQSRAARDNVPKIMVTEFGVWGGALSFTEEQKVLAHRAVFEAAQGKASGFIALDPPRDLDRGLAGTETLKEITAWFKKF